MNLKTTHRIVCAQGDEPLVNMVYAEVGDDEYEIFGAFSGICGGGGLFHQSDGNMQIDDDPGVFVSRLSPEQAQGIFSELERLRASFESYDDDGNLLGLSEIGRAFVNKHGTDGSGYMMALSETASEDFIYDVQDEWNLNFYLD